MKKSLKIMSLILITFMLLLMSFSSIVLGFEAMSGIHDSPRSNAFTNLSGTILGAVYVICTAGGIIAVLVAAIKYMMSSPSEKASIKGQMIGLAIGGIILFGAPQILKLLSETQSWWA